MTLMTSTIGGHLLARANDGEGVKSGPLGLAIILVLCVACYFLFKSMSKHMRRVRDDFPTNGAPPAATSPRATQGAVVQPDPPARPAETPPTDPV